jgi:murein DD-endopeptidase MepM/ murein hydrolase activator NlpD
MKYPVWKGYITQSFKPTHLANDKGWLKVGVKYPEIYSWADGVCVQSTFNATVGGNGISIQHKNVSKYHDYITRYWHLQTRALKVGDKIAKGGVVGIGGNTGLNSTGDHLHFELWIVPKGYVFNFREASKYAVDPQLATFIVKGQPFTGTGVQSMTLDYSQLPLAKPTGTKVRMRSTPAILPNNILADSTGIPIYVPQEGVRFLGITEEVINGYRWAKCIYNQDEVYIAESLLIVEKNVETVTVIKIVEKVKPINATFIEDGVEIKLQVNELLK